MNIIKYKAHIYVPNTQNDGNYVIKGMVIYEGEGSALLRDHVSQKLRDHVQQYIPSNHEVMGKIKWKFLPKI
jgi:hypothetical protein